MNKKISIVTAIVIMLFAVLVTFQITYIAVDNKYDEKMTEFTGQSKLMEKLSELVGIYDEYYIGEMDEDKIIEGVLDGYVASIDKYGSYLTPEEYTDMMTDYGATLVGIGVHVIYNGDYQCIEVINVMPDSPAMESGVEPGDLIVYVEGESVSELGYYPAINKIKGEEGTFTHFTVYRGENYIETVEFEIKRAVVTEQTVMHHIIESDKTIGYVKILSFDSGTYEQFKAAVEELQSSGCTRLVLDVRYNPGGLLTSVTDILDYILPKGPIVRLVDNKDNEEILYSDDSYLDMDMVVLCNKSTASAGELFTAAIKDYDKAEVVGVVTYGKGTVQRIMQLGDGSALSISYKMYSPPISDNYEGVGITPDIIVELDESLAGINIYKIKDEDDNQLQRAIEALNAK